VPIIVSQFYAINSMPCWVVSDFQHKTMAGSEKDPAKISSIHTHHFNCHFPGICHTDFLFHLFPPCISWDAL